MDDSKGERLLSGVKDLVSIDRPDIKNNYGTILYGPILEIAPWNRDPTRTLDSYADLAEANVVDFFEREEKVFFELTSRSNVALDSGVEGTRIEYRWRRTQENCIVGRFDVLLLIGSQF